MALKKPTEPKLFDRVGDYWSSRHENGHIGLSLLNECILRAASKNRDWDALARFVSRANMSNNKAKVVKIIRAAFGNDLTFKLDAKHPAGGVFVMKWEGAYPLAGKNTYSIVKKAIENHKSWDDKDFLAELTKVLPDLPKVEKDKADKLSSWKTRAEKWAKDEGITVEMLIATLQAKPKATTEVINGLVVHRVA